MAGHRLDRARAGQRAEVESGRSRQLGGDQVGRVFTGQQQQVQARLGLHGVREFGQELVPVGLTRVRIGRKVIDLVDRGVDRAGVSLGVRPDEVAHGEID